MNPPESILHTWRKFDRFPMETLTKAWHFNKTSGPKQRSVSLMREHHEQFGVTGNCFDLALWLLDEFRQDGIEAYPIGDDPDPDHMHAAVIALDDKGNRYLCDLGDQWLKPVLLKTSGELLDGFFPAARVGVTSNKTHATVRYHRPNGKTSSQTYSLQPVDMADFLAAAEYSQNHIRPQPLVECRVPHEGGIAHWEFDDWISFLSTDEGLQPEPDAGSLEEWTERICMRTGFSKEIVFTALQHFDSIHKKESR
ncbi:hypothetical protein [Indiicoccus explosivorum]|uniref:hypothetical protein n=1 Tax=Indiicoccus explosivorum TaxID=1917864 RepID=UPI000B441595|nr:hypothetical protein [Indiicoccus explosivorum]